MELARFEWEGGQGGNEGDAIVSYVLLGPDGMIPNNPRVPLLVYGGAFRAGLSGTVDPLGIERLFASHGWRDGWRDGIFAYDHYHSTSPEVLACYSGRALVRLGGGAGLDLELAAGDVVLIPPGVAHRNRGSSSDFRCVAVYPDGLRPDLLRCGSGELAGALIRIGTVPLPEQDPVFGVGGPATRRFPVS